MNKPGFIEGIVVAGVISITGLIGFYTVNLFCNQADTWRVLITIISFGYSIYLLARSQQRIGRITVLASWLLIATATWLYQPPLIHYAFIHLTTLWLIRSLYFHTNSLSVLLDFGLFAFGVAVAFWALIHSGSVMLSLWCLFLVQALFATIPDNNKPATSTQTAINSNATFQQALRTAQSAINSLTSETVN
jgi:hypothetical protein